MDVRTIPVARINPAPYNPRKDLRPGDPEYEALRRSIEEFGYVDPCIWNERTGNLVGGHQRFKILLARGDADIECSVVDMDGVREKALNLALNRISGEWDQERLVAVLQDLAEMNYDVSLTGFDAAEIDALLSAGKDPGAIAEDDFDVDGELAQIEEPVTQPGDLWVLGRHRLLCGDATALADVQKLMAGAKAAMVFTDPPYNVDYEGATKDALRILNDKMSNDRFLAFLTAAFTNMQAATEEGGAIYVCHAEITGVAFRTAFTAAGWLIKQCLIWVKNTFVLGRQDYQWRHEPILYGWKPGASHRWYGGRKQHTVIMERAGLVIEQAGDGALLTFSTGPHSVVVKVPAYEVLFAGDDDATTTWWFDKPVRNADHPTKKPIGLCARALLNSSQPGEVVLDTFLGSGSTLIAAEQTARACYGTELDPRYCDVIVKRWETLTGLKAVRNCGGETNKANA